MFFFVGKFSKIHPAIREFSKMKCVVRRMFNENYSNRSVGPVLYLNPRHYQLRPNRLKIRLVEIVRFVVWNRAGARNPRVFQPLQKWVIGIRKSWSEVLSSHRIRTPAFRILKMYVGQRITSRVVRKTSRKLFFSRLFFNRQIPQHCKRIAL